MMYRLARWASRVLHYFTWRNTKAELTDYLRELTTTDVVDISARTSSSTHPTSILTSAISGRAGF